MTAPVIVPPTAPTSLTTPKSVRKTRPIVSIGQGAADLLDNRRDRLGPQRQAIGLNAEQLIAQAGTVDEVEDHEVHLALGAEVEDADDVGMIEPGDCACFTLEPITELIVVAEVRIEELDRDRPIERFLDTFEHQPHPAPGDEASDLVSLEDSPDQTVDRLIAGHRDTPLSMPVEQRLTTSGITAGVFLGWAS
jgi:hypothetical protein